MKKRNAILAVAMIAGVSSAVWAQGMKSHDGMDMKMNMDSMMPSPSDADSTKDFKTAHMKMMHDMMMEFSGDADVDFVRGMIPHHQGAIEMAKVQLEHGKDPELRKLAQTIISDQEKEIAQMQDWLKTNKK